MTSIWSLIFCCLPYASGQLWTTMQCMKRPVAHSFNSTWFWIELPENCCEPLKFIMKYISIQFCERPGHGRPFHALTMTKKNCRDVCANASITHYQGSLLRGWPLILADFCNHCWLVDIAPTHPNPTPYPHPHSHLLVLVKISADKHPLNQLPIILCHGVCNGLCKWEYILQPKRLRELLRNVLKLADSNGLQFCHANEIICVLVEKS